MDLRNHLEGWKSAMYAGEISNKRFSPLTVNDYARRVDILLDEYGFLDFNTFKLAMRAIPPEQQGKQGKLYKAIICFAKYLKAENLPIDSRLVVSTGSVPVELIPFRPKINHRPKQTVVSSAALKRVKNSCTSDFDKFVVLFLSSTGLRVSEACSLTVGDCDLTGSVINNIKGKGGKTRRVALSRTCVKAISGYILTRPNINDFQALFIRPDGKICNRQDLWRILNAVGLKSGDKVTPHALRRAYVTISHASGASMDDLRLSCGHSDIKTTMGYCKTSEAEMLARMQNIEIDI